MSTEMATEESMSDPTSNTASWRRRFSARRAAILRLNSLLLAQLLLCSLANAQPTAGAAEDALSVRWTPPCDQPGEPFFTVTMASNGDVRYVGSELVREPGMRSATVSKRAVRRLAARAARLASGATAGPAVADPPPRLPYDHCVRYSAGADQAEVALSSRDESTLSFARAIDEHVEFARWICPARGGDATPISAANYCETAIVSLHLRPDNNCLGLHVVDVFENGSVHYYASDVVESDGRSRRVYFGDRYDQVTVGDVGDLSQLIRGFRAFEVPETITPSGEPLFRYGTPAELLRLRDSIDELTRFDWAEIRASQECTGQTDSYAIALR